ncbi:MAG TPA: ketoacyl-ACP synthase III family protein [Catenuloplanes sp.]
MKVEKDVYIRGNGVRLPATLTVADAIAAGDCDPRLVRRTDVVSVSVSPEESAAQMAAAAARTALDRAGATGADVDLILHADTYYQGQDLWPVASYIQRVAVGNQCMAVEVKQMSSGGMAAIELATAYLTAEPNRCDALLTTADRFCLPGIDRWRTDPGTPYADGGTALVLSRRGGYARLRSIVMLSDPELEGLHRGDDPFGPAPFSQRMPVDFANAKQAFAQQFGFSYAVSRVKTWQRATMKQALADADVELGEIDWIVLPHFGQRRLEAGYFREFDIDPDRTTWHWSRTIGHLGAGDQFASFGHLADAGHLRAGQRCLLVGVGAGYTWGCAVVEVLERPAWAGSC